MKTDGLGLRPSLLGPPSPCFIIVCAPHLPVFFFLLHFLSFLLWMCLLYALLFLSSGTLFLLFTFFLKHDGNRERRAKFLTFSTTCPPSLPTSLFSRPPTLSRLPAPRTDFAVTAWGFALVKCTNVPKGQLKMYLVGGVLFFFPEEQPSPLSSP